MFHSLVVLRVLCRQPVSNGLQISSLWVCESRRTPSQSPLTKARSNGKSQCHILWRGMCLHLASRGLQEKGNSYRRRNTRWLCRGMLVLFHTRPPVSSAPRQQGCNLVSVAPGSILILLLIGMSKSKSSWQVVLYCFSHVSSFYDFAVTCAISDSIWWRTGGPVRLTHKEVRILWSFITAVCNTWFTWLLQELWTETTQMWIIQRNYEDISEEGWVCICHTMPPIQGRISYIPAARSRYITARFSAATGCRSRELMIPRKIVDAYKAPSTLWMPSWVWVWPPSFQKMNLQVISKESQTHMHFPQHDNILKLRYAIITSGPQKEHVERPHISKRI